MDSTEATTGPWRTAPLDQVITHLLDAYHKPLRAELGRLAALTTELAIEAGRAEPRLLELRRCFSELDHELHLHMEKEEQILFPMILAGDGAHAGGPIQVMEHEHVGARALLAELRRLTDGYRAAPGASERQVTVFAGLAALERAMNAHIDLENHVLHPRALAD